MMNYNSILTILCEDKLIIVIKLELQDKKLHLFVFFILCQGWPSTLIAPVVGKIQFNSSLSVYCFSRYKSLLSSFTGHYVSTICLVVAYQWWQYQVDVHMAEMYDKNWLMIIKILTLDHLSF